MLSTTARRRQISRTQSTHYKSHLLGKNPVRKYQQSPRNGAVPSRSHRRLWMATMMSLRLPDLVQIRPQAEAEGDWVDDTLYLDQKCTRCFSQVVWAKRIGGQEAEVTHIQAFLLEDTQVGKTGRGGSVWSPGMKPPPYPPRLLL